MRFPARLAPLVVLLALPFVFLHRAFGGGADALLGLPGWDMTTLFYAQKAFAAERIRAGDFPLWNPNLFCGIPFHATIHPALLYPPNALFLALPIASAFNWLFALHVALAGVFTYALLRESGVRRAAALFGAVAFAFSARVLLHVHVGHFPHVAALAWVPGLFWLAERLARQRSARAAIALGAAFALSLLAGFPQYPVYAAAGIAILFAARAAFERAQARDAGLALASLAGALAFGAALAAAQLLPGLDYARDSLRSGAARDFLAMGYMPFANFATLLLPGLTGDMRRAPYFGEWSFWTTCAYGGVGVVAFATVAFAAAPHALRRRALPWGALALVSALLALGAQTPLFEIVSRVPVIGAFRGISKFLALATLALAVLSAFGLEALLRAIERGHGARRDDHLDDGDAAANPARVVFRFAVICGVICGTGLAVWLAFAGTGGLERAGALYGALASPNEYFPGDPPPAAPETIADVRGAIARDAARLALLAAAFAAAALVAVRLARAPRPARATAAFALAAIALLAADLFEFAHPHLRALSVARDIELAPQLARALASMPPGARFGATERRMMRGALYGAPAVGGYEGNLPKRTLAFVNFAADRPPDVAIPTFQPGRISPLLDLLVMQDLVLDRPTRVDESQFRLAAQGERFALYERARRLPHAFLAHNVEIAADLPAIWTAIRDGAHDPYAVATVERAEDLESVAPLAPDASASEPLPEVALDGADRVVIRARPAARALLVLLDPVAPGWRARVDGEPARIVPVFGFFRGVYIEPRGGGSAPAAGATEVVFTYRPSSMTAGAAISLGACALAIAFLIATHTRNDSRNRRRNSHGRID